MSKQLIQFAFCVSLIVLLTSNHLFDDQLRLSSIYNFTFEWDETYDTQVSSAERDLSKVLQSWYTYLLANEEAYYDTVVKINNIYKQAENNIPDERLTRLYSSLILMRMKAIQGSFWGMLKEFREGEADIRYFLKKGSNNEREKLVVALYHALAGAASSKNIKVKLLLLSLPSPDESLGIELLEALSTSSDAFVAVESMYFMGKYYADIKHDSVSGLAYFSTLHKAYPSNPIFIFECARLSSETSESINLLRDVVNNELNISPFQKDTFIQMAMNQLGQ